MDISAIHAIIKIAKPRQLDFHKLSLASCYLYCCGCVCGVCARVCVLLKKCNTMKVGFLYYEFLFRNETIRRQNIFILKPR